MLQIHIDTVRRTNEKIARLNAILTELAEDYDIINLNEAPVTSIGRMLTDALRLSNWSYLRLRNLERMAAADRHTSNDQNSVFKAASEPTLAGAMESLRRDVGQKG